MSGGGALLPPVIVRLMGDVRQLRTSMAEARTMVDGTAAGMQRAGTRAFNGMATMGKAVSLVGAGVAVASIKMAGDFQAQTMVLHTAAGESVKGLDTVRKGILDIAKGTGTDWHNLTEGMYQIEKSGKGGAEGLKILKAAAQGAREENASLESVTNAMTSVMASYHLGADKSVQVMNAMKTAAGEGKMTMEQFAGSLSTVLPIASANKISFAEVSGALATLTQHGTSAREGTQELGATIRALAAPNNVAVQEMQRLGLSSTDVSTKLGQRGLTGTLSLLSETVLNKMGKSGTVLLDSFNKTKQAAADADQMVKSMPPNLQKLAASYSKGSVSLGDWRKELKGLPPEQANLLSQYATLQNKTNGFSAELKKGGPAAQTYTEALKKMTGGAVGLNTTLQLTGENADGFKERVKKVSASYNHATKDVEGWKETQDQFNVKLAKAKETVQVLAIEIGTKLIPVVTSVVDWFGRHKDIAIALAGVIAGVLTLSVVAYGVKVVMSAAQGVIAMGKLGLSAVQAGARVVQGFRSAQVAQSTFSGAAGTFGGNLRKAFDAAKSGAVTAGRAVAEFGKSVATAALSAGRTAWAGAVSGIQSVGLAMKTAALASLDFVKSMAASALAALRAAAAWTAQKVELIATTVAEKAAALAQWALNVAMDANPITLIVIALLALVAAIVWLATKTQFFQTVWSVAWGAVETAALAVWRALSTAFHATLNALMAAWSAASGWLEAAWAATWGAIKAVVKALLSATVGVIKSALDGARAVVSGALGAMSSAFSGAMSAIHSVASTVWSGIRSTITNAINGAKSAVSGAVSGIGSALSSIKLMAMNALSGAGSWLASAGRAIIDGLIGGIKSAIGGVKSVLGGITDMLPSWKGPPAKDRLLLHGAGQMIIGGLVNGMTSGVGAVKRTAVGLAQTTVSAFSQELGIQSPSRAFAQLGAYVMHGLVSGLTGSTARVRAATERIARDLYTNFGSHHAALQRVIGRDNDLMMRLANNRDNVASRLKSAQSQLASLQKDWVKERDTVAKGIMQGASIITASPDQGRAVNSFDVVDQMRKKVAEANQFAANLNQLQKKGLSTDMVQQLAQAGVDQAGATAQALAAGTRGQIQEMNKLQNNLQGAANNTGAAVADSMYGAGIKSAQGLVKGLQSQEAAIEKQMMRIAQAMQKAIKYALGIKSPSRVFEGIGTWIPKGLAKGIDGSAAHATNAARSLAGAVTGAAAMGTAPGLALVGGGGRGETATTVIHNHYEIKVAGSVATIDGIARELEASFERRGMRNPATYPGYRGR